MSKFLNNAKKVIFLIMLLHLWPKVNFAQTAKFKALVLTERGGLHEGFVVAALAWLQNFSAKQDFEYTIINNTDAVNKQYLSDYQLFIQLNFPPYMWSKEAEEAFIQYIEEGKGGWIGFHHATLLGEFDGYSMWNWFSQFMGGIRFKNYIAERASGTVYVENAEHPVMKGVPSSFTITDDEWYVFDKDPRPNVQVLAHVDEQSYQPPSAIKMGDHPVIWSNNKMKAPNIYFLMGHHENLFKSKAFMTMFGNAILWAADKKKQTN